MLYVATNLSCACLGSRWVYRIIWLHVCPVHENCTWLHIYHDHAQCEVVSSSIDLVHTTIRGLVYEGNSSHTECTLLAGMVAFQSGPSSFSHPRVSNWWCAGPNRYSSYPEGRPSFSPVGSSAPEGIADEIHSGHDAHDNIVCFMLLIFVLKIDTVNFDCIHMCQGLLAHVR